MFLSWRIAFIRYVSFMQGFSVVHYEKISNVPFAVQGVLAAFEIVLTPVEVKALEDVGVS